MQGTVSRRGRCRDQRGPMEGSSRTRPSLGGHWDAGNGAARVSSCLPSCPALTHFLPVWGQAHSTVPRAHLAAALQLSCMQWGSVPCEDMGFVQQCLCLSHAVGSQCDAHTDAPCHSIFMPQHVPMASGTIPQAWAALGMWRKVGREETLTAATGSCGVLRAAWHKADAQRLVPTKAACRVCKGGAAPALQALPMDAEPPSPHPKQGVSQPTAVGLGCTRTVTSVL